MGFAGWLLLLLLLLVAVVVAGLGAEPGGIQGLLEEAEERGGCCHGWEEPLEPPAGGAALNPEPEKPLLEDPGMLDPRFPRSANGSKLWDLALEKDGAPEAVKAGLLAVADMLAVVLVAPVAQLSQPPSRSG